MPDFSFENNYVNSIVAGIDEAGRGPLAGPIVSACVLLNQENFPKEINDSKKLTKNLRKKLFVELQEKAKFGIGIVDEKIIDEINILQATKLSMRRAFEDFQKKYDNKITLQTLLVDGNIIPFSHDNIKIAAIVKGDQKSFSIAAASIIAKEIRDEIMKKIHLEFPQFGFDKHAGYGTKFHIEQIKKFGVCKYHRLSFEPIKSMLNVHN